MVGSVQVVGMKNLQGAMRAIETSMPNLRAETLNNMAFFGFSLARNKTVPEAFDFIRNRWTQGSVRFSKATRSPGSSSIVGSVQPYMAKQEFGDSNSSIGHIPTNDARIALAKPKVVARRNKTARGGNFPNRSLVRGNRAVFVAIKKAQRSGDRGPFYFEINGKHGTQRGLYRFRGRGNSEIRMIHNTSKKRINLKKRPWLAPVLPPTMIKGQQFFIRNFKRRLKSF